MASVHALKLVNKEDSPGKGDEKQSFGPAVTNSPFQAEKVGFNGSKPESELGTGREVTISHGMKILEAQLISPAPFHCVSTYPNPGGKGPTPGTRASAPKHVMPELRTVLKIMSGALICADVYIVISCLKMGTLG